MKRPDWLPRISFEPLLSPEAQQVLWAGFMGAGLAFITVSLALALNIAFSVPVLFAGGAVMLAVGLIGLFGGRAD